MCVPEKQTYWYQEETRDHLDWKEQLTPAVGGEDHVSA